MQSKKLSKKDVEQYVSLAKELSYDKKYIERIERATTEEEAERILATARKNKK